jgi:LDH2 family malate/lactate/ureidoglycolate dehydrogenase
MSNQSVGSNKKGEKRDPDLAFAEVAMKRAAQKARERARQAGAGVAVLRDGNVVEELHSGRSALLRRPLLAEEPLFVKRTRGS